MVVILTCTTHKPCSALNPPWPGGHIKSQADIRPTTLSNPTGLPPWQTPDRPIRYPRSVCACACVCVCISFINHRKISSVSSNYKAAWRYSRQLPPLWKERACQNSTWLCPALSRVISSDRLAVALAPLCTSALFVLFFLALGNRMVNFLLKHTFAGTFELL